jgi:hypothetical protein
MFSSFPISRPVKETVCDMEVLHCNQFFARSKELAPFGCSVAARYYTAMISLPEAKDF